jgi:hypothetical protein
VIQCGCPIIGFEEIDAKPRHWESSGFASPRWAGDDKHSGRHLSAEIAASSVPHTLRNIGAHAFPGLVGNTQTLQLFCCRLHPLSRPLQMRIGLRSVELRPVSRGHYTFIIFLMENRSLN